MYHLSSLVFISLIQSFCVYADICPNSAYCRLTEWHAWNCTGCVTGAFKAVRERGVCCSSPYLEICLIGCKLNKTDVQQTGDCDVYCKTSTYPSRGAMALSAAPGNMTSFAGSSSSLSKNGLTSIVSTSNLRNSLNKASSTVGLSTKQNFLVTNTMHNSISTNVVAAIVGARNTGNSTETIVGLSSMNTAKSTETIVGTNSVKTNRVTAANKQQSLITLPEDTVEPQAFRGSDQSTRSIVSSNFSIQYGDVGTRNETATNNPSIKSEESVCLGHCKKANDWENCMTDCLSVPYPNVLCKILWIGLLVLGFVTGGMIMATILACLKRRKQMKGKVLPTKRVSKHSSPRQKTSKHTFNDKLLNRDKCGSFTRSKNIPVQNTTTTEMSKSTRVRVQLDDVG